MILILVPLLILNCWVLRFLNGAVRRREDIDEAKSRVRISKAKYLQALRKRGRRSGNLMTSKALDITQLIEMTEEDLWEGRSGR